MGVFIADVFLVVFFLVLHCGSGLRGVGYSWGVFVSSLVVWWFYIPKIKKKKEGVGPSQRFSP